MKVFSVPVVTLLAASTAQALGPPAVTGTGTGGGFVTSYGQPSYGTSNSSLPYATGTGAPSGHSRSRHHPKPTHQPSPVNPVPSGTPSCLAAPSASGPVLAVIGAPAINKYCSGKAPKESFKIKVAEGNKSKYSVEAFFEKAKSAPKACDTIFKKKGLSGEKDLCFAPVNDIFQTCRSYSKSHKRFSRKSNIYPGPTLGGSVSNACGKWTFKAVA